VIGDTANIAARLEHAAEPRTILVSEPIHLLARTGPGDRAYNEAGLLASGVGLDEIRAFADSCLAQVYLVAGGLREAVEAGERALPILRLSAICGGPAGLSRT